jgi:hypothetical protein
VTDAAGDVVTTDQLPGGNYIVSAKASFRNATAGASTTLTCVLQGGGLTIDSATVDSTDGSQTIALLGVANFGGTTTVVLTCSTSTGGAVAVSDVEVVAMSVVSIDINDPSGAIL